MHDSSSIPFPPLSTFDRLRAMTGIVVTGVVFLAWASRVVLAPTDPLGSLSVLSCHMGWGILVICAFLAAVLAAGVTVLSGGKLVEMGTFAVALGLSMASLKYQNAGYLWMTIGQGSEDHRRTLAIWMAVESLGWFGVVMAGHAASCWAIAQFKLQPVIHRDPSEESRRGFLTVLVMIPISLILIRLLSSGTDLAPVEKGQVCFAWAVSFWLAALIAYQISGAHSPVWAYAAVVLAVVLGYLWTVVHPALQIGSQDLSQWIHFSPTAFGTALPIQAIMVGTAAAIFGNWHQRQLTRYAVLEDQERHS